MLWLMPLPLVYHEDYVTPLPAGHRFPMPKFGLLREHLEASGMPVAHRCERATMDQLRLVHDPGYLDAFCGGALGRDAVRRIGLPWSAGLVNRTITAVGGTILTARLAVEHGVACNTAGGTHHAHAGFGSGFCILNDLAVAARVLQRDGLADVVLILDLDVHQGDGTAAIFADDPSVFTFSMHCGKNFPLRKRPGDLDVSLPENTGDADYLEILAHGVKPGDGRPRALSSAAFAGIEKLLERIEPDVVLYDAGVDPHADDKLGRLRLTDDGLTARDRMVIRACRAHGVPIACVIGGGYHADHALLARRHATVHRAAAEVLNAPATTAAGST